MPDPALRDICLGRHAEALFERFDEVAWRQSNHGSQVGVADRGLQLDRYVMGQAFFPPRRKGMGARFDRSRIGMQLRAPVDEGRCLIDQALGCEKVGLKGRFSIHEKS